MKIVEFENHKLSKLSFGTVQLGLKYGISNQHGKPTQQTADSIINYLVRSGINCFDTAVAYGNSEEVLGAALNYNDVYIVSKVKSKIFTTNLEHTINRSLNRLRTKKLFGLMLHDSELLFDWKKEYTDSVVSLQKRNIIDYFGVSIYTSQEFKLAISNSNIQIIQIPFNLFDQRAIDEKWFIKAKEANKLIFIRSIFLQGLFFMDEAKLSENLIEARPYIKILHKLCKDLNLSIAQLAIAYVDNIAKDAVLLFGCDTLDQAKDNIKSYNNLPKIEEDILIKINKIFSNMPEHIINPGQWRLS